MDEQQKQLMNELGVAINHALSESMEIESVIARLKEGGHEVFLQLEAKISIGKSSKTSSDTNPEADRA